MSLPLYHSTEGPQQFKAWASINVVGHFINPDFLLNPDEIHSFTKEQSFGL